MLNGNRERELQSILFGPSRHLRDKAIIGINLLGHDHGADISRRFYRKSDARRFSPSVNRHQPKFFWSEQCD